MTRRQSKKKRLSVSEIERTVAKKKKKKPRRKKATKKRAKKKSTAIVDARMKAKFAAFASTLLRPQMTQMRAYQEVFGKRRTRKQAENEIARVMKHPLMQEELRRAKAMAEKGDEVRKDWAINALKSMVDLNIVELLDGRGFVLPIDKLRDLPIEVQRSIREIKITKTVEPVMVVRDGEEEMEEKETHYAEVKLHDKIKAIEQIAKIKQWIKPQQLVFNIGERLQQAEARLAEKDSLEGVPYRVVKD